MAESPFINIQLAEFLTRAASMGVQNAQNAERLRLQRKELDEEAKSKERNLKLREENLALAEKRLELDAEIKRAQLATREAESKFRKMDIESRIITRTQRHDQNNQRLELLRQSAAARTSTLQQKAIQGELENVVRNIPKDKYKNPLYAAMTYDEVYNLYRNSLSMRTRDLLPDQEEALFSQIDELENALGVKGDAIDEYQKTLAPERKQLFDSLFRPQSTAPAPAGIPTELGAQGPPVSMLSPPSSPSPSLGIEGSVDKDFNLFAQGIRAVISDPQADRTNITETIIKTLLDPTVKTDTKRRLGVLLNELDPNYLRQITQGVKNARQPGTK